MIMVQTPDLADRYVVAALQIATRAAEKNESPIRTDTFYGGS